MPNASAEPMSMFHQSDVIPCAAWLCGVERVLLRAAAARARTRRDERRQRRRPLPTASPFPIGERLPPPEALKRADPKGS